MHALVIAWLLLLLFRVSGLEQAVVAAVCVVLLNGALAYRSFAPDPLLWLGGISYSLFLIHVPIGGRVVNLLMVLWGFRILIERPSHQWSRRLLLPS